MGPGMYVSACAPCPCRLLPASTSPAGATRVASVPVAQQPVLQRRNKKPALADAPDRHTHTDPPLRVRHPLLQLLTGTGVLRVLCWWVEARRTCECVTECVTHCCSCAIFAFTSSTCAPVGASNRRRKTAAENQFIYKDSQLDKRLHWHRNFAACAFLPG